MLIVEIFEDVCVDVISVGGGKVLRSSSAANEAPVLVTDSDLTDVATVENMGSGDLGRVVIIGAIVASLGDSVTLAVPVACGAASVCTGVAATVGGTAEVVELLDDTASFPGRDFGGKTVRLRSHSRNLRP